MRLIEALRQLGTAIGRHERCVLGRGNEFRAILGGIADHARGVADIFRNVIAGTHLDTGGARSAHFRRS